MKPNRKRPLAFREVLLIAAPFLAMRLVLALTVDIGALLFWQRERNISSLTAMQMNFIPLGFAFFYLISIGVFYRRSLDFDWSSVVTCALLSYFLAAVMCPIP